MVDRNTLFGFLNWGFLPRIVMLTLIGSLPCASFAKGPEFYKLFDDAISYNYSANQPNYAASMRILVVGDDILRPLTMQFPGHSNDYDPSGCINDWAKNEPNQSRFHFCLLTADYNFVVPRGLTPAVKSWTYDRWEYTLLASGQTFQIGERVFDDVYVIAAPPEAGYYSNYHNRRMVSYYSKRFGLLAFQMQNIDDDDKGPLWVLDGDIGIGAMPARDVQP